MSKLIKNTFYAPLSIQIQKEYNALITLLAQAPDSLVIQKGITYGSEVLNLRQLIAYQIGWAHFLIYWYQSGIENKIPQMPGFGFTKWEYTKIAHYFFIHFSYSNKKVQQAKFHECVIRIINIVEKEYKNGNLDTIGIWKWCTLNSGKAWPLSKWVTVNTVAPYKRAQTAIKKSIKILRRKND